LALYNITMPIEKKPDDECSTVQIKLCGESKKKVLAKQKELDKKGFPRVGKALAILKLILGK